MTETKFQQTGAMALAEQPPPRPPQLDRPPLLDRLKRMLGVTRAPTRHGVINPKAPPWHSVTLLNFFRNGAYLGFATGFLAKPDVIVTAGHNLQRTNPSAVGIYPGYDAKNNPSPMTAGRAWAWHGSRDVAVVVAASPLTSPIALGGAPSGVVMLAGYAYPYNDNSPRMTYGEGQCASQGSQMTYKIGVREGDSGSPVIVPHQPGQSAVGVHFYSKVQSGDVIGVGEVIDDELRDILAELERLARAQIS